MSYLSRWLNQQVNEPLVRSRDRVLGEDSILLRLLSTLPNAAQAGSSVENTINSIVGDDTTVFKDDQKDYGVTGPVTSDTSDRAQEWREKYAHILDAINNPANQKHTEVQSWLKNVGDVAAGEAQVAGKTSQEQEAAREEAVLEAKYALIYRDAEGTQRVYKTSEERAEMTEAANLRHALAGNFLAVGDAYDSAAAWAGNRLNGFEEILNGSLSDTAVLDYQAAISNINRLAGDVNTETNVAKTQQERSADDNAMIVEYKKQVADRIQVLKERATGLEDNGDVQSLAAAELCRTEIDKQEKARSVINIRSGETLDHSVRQSIASETKVLAAANARAKVDNATDSSNESAVLLEGTMVIGAETLANLAAPGVGGIIVSQAVGIADQAGVLTSPIDTGEGADVNRRGGALAMVTVQAFGGEGMPAANRAVGWSDIYTDAIDLGTAGIAAGATAVMGGMLANAGAPVLEAGEKAVLENVIGRAGKKLLTNALKDVGEASSARALTEAETKALKSAVGVARAGLERMKGMTIAEIRDQLKEAGLNKLTEIASKQSDYLGLLAVTQNDPDALEQLAGYVERTGFQVLTPSIADPAVTMARESASLDTEVTAATPSIPGVAPIFPMPEIPRPVEAPQKPTTLDTVLENAEYAAAIIRDCNEVAKEVGTEYAQKGFAVGAEYAQKGFAVGAEYAQKGFEAGKEYAQERLENAIAHAKVGVEYVGQTVVGWDLDNKIQESNSKMAEKYASLEQYDEFPLAGARLKDAHTGIYAKALAEGMSQAQAEQEAKDQMKPIVEQVIRQGQHAHSPGMQALEAKINSLTPPATAEPEPVRLAESSTPPVPTDLPPSPPVAEPQPPVADSPQPPVASPVDAQPMDKIAELMKQQARLAVEAAQAKRVAEELISNNAAPDAVGSALETVQEKLKIAQDALPKFKEEVGKLREELTEEQKNAVNEQVNNMDSSLKAIDDFAKDPQTTAKALPSAAAGPASTGIPALDAIIGFISAITGVDFGAALGMKTAEPAPAAPENSAPAAAATSEVPAEALPAAKQEEKPAAANPQAAAPAAPENSAPATAAKPEVPAEASTSPKTEDKKVAANQQAAAPATPENPAPAAAAKPDVPAEALPAAKQEEKPAAANPQAAAPAAPENFAPAAAATSEVPADDSPAAKQEEKPAAAKVAALEAYRKSVEAVAQANPLIADKTAFVKRAMETVGQTVADKPEAEIFDAVVANGIKAGKLTERFRVILKETMEKVNIPDISNLSTALKYGSMSDIVNEGVNTFSEGARTMGTAMETALAAFKSQSQGLTDLAVSGGQSVSLSTMGQIAPGTAVGDIDASLGKKNDGTALA